MYVEALALARAVGDQRDEAYTTRQLGEVALHLGDLARAQTLLTDSLSAYRKWADARGIAWCLLAYIDLWQMQGYDAQAARLLGFVEAWLQANQLQFVPLDRISS